MRDLAWLRKTKNPPRPHETHLSPLPETRRQQRGIALIGCLVLGVTLSSVWIVVAGVLTTVLGNVWMWRRCELFPMERKTAQTAQRVGWATTLLAVAMAFLG